MGTLLRLILALGVALVLASCASFGGRPDGERPLNPILDDVASIVITFDLPRGLGPGQGSLFTFDVVKGKMQVHLKVALVRADVDSLPAGLPPPGNDRAYYLFTFSEADQQSIRDTQINAQLNNATERHFKMGFYPRFCAAGPIDSKRMTVSVYGVLAGRAPGTFANQVKLSDLVDAGTTIPQCS